MFANCHKKILAILCFQQGNCFPTWSSKGCWDHGTVHVSYGCRVGAGYCRREAALTTCGTTVGVGIYGAGEIFAVRWCGISSKNEQKRRKRPEKVLRAFSQYGGYGFELSLWPLARSPRSPSLNRRHNLSICCSTSKSKTPPWPWRRLYFGIQLLSILFQIFAQWPPKILHVLGHSLFQIGWGYIGNTKQAGRRFEGVRGQLCRWRGLQKKGPVL